MANLLIMFIFMGMMVISGFIFGIDGLSMNYYLFSCPFVEFVVKNNVNRALQNDPTLAAGLVRMHFHDCFIEVPSLFLSLSLVNNTFFGSDHRRLPNKRLISLLVFKSEFCNAQHQICHCENRVWSTRSTSLVP